MEKFMESLIPIIGIIGVIVLPAILVFIIVVRYLKFRHDEKMELIKQGLPSGSCSTHKNIIPNKLRILRNGLLAMGVGLGLVVAKLIVVGYFKDHFVVYLSSVMIGMGIAYIIFFFISSHKEKSIDANS